MEIESKHHNFSIFFFSVVTSSSVHIQIDFPKCVSFFVLTYMRNSNMLSAILEIAPNTLKNDPFYNPPTSHQPLYECKVLPISVLPFFAGFFP